MYKRQLLQGAPEWLDQDAMQAHIIREVPSVAAIHHVHVWCMTPQDLMLTMHVRLRDAPKNPTECIRHIKELLKSEYGIGHTTVEIEFDDCADQ